MKRVYLLLILLCFTLTANDYCIVVHKDFPLKQLSAQQLKSIYLKKVHYIDGVKVVALNISARDPLRKKFDTLVLSMSPYTLKQYWKKAHYRGIQPPKVVKSFESAVSYLQNVEGSIAYVPKGYTFTNMHKLEIKP